MATYDGQLTANKIMSGIFNMIISQYVSAKVVDGLFTELHDEAVEEAGLYGDTKLFYFVQPLKSVAWDETDTNLLARALPADPYCQKLVIDKYRQCGITLDSYLSKNAWASEGAFSSFHSIMLGQLQNTKKIEETGIVNVFVGTTSSSVVSDIELDVSEYPSIGQAVAELVADKEVELKDLNRLNDLGYARAYNPEDMRIVISSKYANQIRNIDLPALFHKDFFESVMSKAKVLPAKYFGVAPTASDVGANKVIKADGTYDNTKGTLRAKEECDITVSGVVTHCYPGDELPNGATVYASSEFKIACYIVKDDIICKIMAKDSVKMLSAFTVSTSFFNAKNLSENTYLTWGRSEPAYLLDRPFLTVKAI